MKYHFLVLCLLIAATYGDFVLVDQSFQGNDFSDNGGWTVQGNARADLFNTCKGVKIFGGDRVFGTKAVALKNVQLPPHHTLKLKLQFWKIDSWDNEIAQVWVDDGLVWSRSFAVAQGQPMCGRTQGWNWDVVNVEVDLQHTGPNAVIVITSTLDQDASDESWGFRDFQLLVDKCPDNCSACQKDDAQASCSIWSSAFAQWTSLTLNSPLDTSCWNVVGAKGETTSCGGLELFGGYDKFGTKAAISKLVKLPPHYKLKIKTLFAKIDSWDNEVAYLKLDGTTIWQRSFQYNQGYFVSVCGQPNDWRELFNRVEVDADHSAEQANLEFSTNLNEAANNESWGVRDLYVFVAKCTPNCAKCTGPKPADCQVCAQNYIFQAQSCVSISNFVLLESAFNEDKFNDVNGWILKGAKGDTKISECAGKSLLGGYNSMGQGGSAEKTFNIPGHRRLRLTLQLYKIDSWDNEWLYIQVDGVDVHKQQWNIQTGGSSICGAANSGWNDAIFSVDEIFNHQAEKATVLFTSTLNQAADDESWGFRQFKLFYEPYDQCAVFFTQYEFKGEAYEFCAKSPNFLKDKVPPKIRSIKVPPQGRVTLYESSDYNGKKVVFTSDQPYLSESEFSFLQAGSVEAPEWIEVPLNGQVE